MVQKAIRDLHGEGSYPKRFCDVIIDGDKIYLVQKKEKNKYLKIHWEDVVYQVEAAKSENRY